MPVSIATTPTPGTDGGYVPEIGAGVGQRPLPDVRPTPPWFWISHPERWGVFRKRDGVMVILPVLGRFRMINGLNNVHAREGGGFTVAAGWDEKQLSGWSQVPYDIDGPGTSYLRRVERRGRVHHYSRFATFYPETGDSDERVGHLDYVDWLAEHAAAGRLGRPTPGALRTIRNAAEMDIRICHGRAQSGDDVARDRAERARATIACLDAR